MRFARVNGGVIHFSDEGPPGAPTIAFSNSLGTDFRIWDEVVKPLAAHLRVIRYDGRGHGLSELRTGASAISDFASDLAALLDSREVRKATIVGLSIGGMVAQELYRLRPDLIRSLVLCDTAHRIGTTESWTNRIDAINKGGLESIADAVMRPWFTRDYNNNCADAVAGWRAMLTRMPAAGYLAACAALRDADLTLGASRVRAPTLCIVGDQDTSTSVALVRELSGLIPTAKLEIIIGAAHLPCIEKPAIVRGLIEAHLKDIAA